MAEVTSRSTAGRETAMRHSVLVIDDEPMILDAIRIILGDLGCEVVATSVPTDGVAAAIARPFDLILTDIRMPVKNGAEIVEAIRAARPDARIVVISAFPNDPLVRRALDAGAIDIVRKPFEISKLLDYLDGRST